jgi:hypothetical protein
MRVLHAQATAKTEPRSRTQQEQMILFLRLAKPLLFAVYADLAST